MMMKKMMNEVVVEGLRFIVKDVFKVRTWKEFKAFVSCVVLVGIGAVALFIKQYEGSNLQVVLEALVKAFQ